MKWYYCNSADIQQLIRKFLLFSIKITSFHSLKSKNGKPQDDLLFKSRFQILKLLYYIWSKIATISKDQRCTFICLAIYLLIHPKMLSGWLGPRHCARVYRCGSRKGKDAPATVSLSSEVENGVICREWRHDSNFESDKVQVSLEK